MTMFTAAMVMMLMIIATCAFLEGLRDMRVAFWDWQGGGGTLPVVLVIFNHTNANKCLSKYFKPLETVKTN